MVIMAGFALTSGFQYFTGLDQDTRKQIINWSDVLAVIFFWTGSNYIIYILFIKKNKKMQHTETERKRV